MPQNRKPKGSQDGGQYDFGGFDRADGTLTDTLDGWSFNDPLEDQEPSPPSPLDPDDDLVDDDPTEPAGDPTVQQLIERADLIAAAVDTRRADSVDAQRALRDQHGSVEQAAGALGEDIAARGEQHAGISAEQVYDNWQQRATDAQRTLEDALNRRALRQAAYTETGSEHDYLEYQQAWSEAADEMRHAADVRIGVDDITRQQMRQLVDGYQQALAEVRPLGGTLTVHPKSKPAAVEAFDEAAQLYPTDWIEASNGRADGNPAGVNGMRFTQGPIVKIVDSRAHYADVTVETTKRRVNDQRRVHNSVYQGWYDETSGRSSNPRYEFEPLPDDEAAYWSEYMSQTTFEVHRDPRADPNKRPRGRGWQHWTDPTDPTRQVWRRPKQRMELVDAHVVSEITANSDRLARVQGRSGTFDSCAHELAHRFQYSVYGLGSLEKQFRDRRARPADANQQPELVQLYPRARGRAREEVAYPDQFTVAYTGKDYGEDSPATEVMSTGAEGVFAGRFGGFMGIGINRVEDKTANDAFPMYDSDPELRDFVLGTMASVGRKQRH